MADNYLITGYWGEPHVTAENDRGINAATFGAGRFVLPVGEQFRAEYIGNNTIRMYDGKLMDNGAAAGIPAGEYIDLLIPEAAQGMNRNDLIVFQYAQDSSTLIETGSFVVVRGAEVSGSASDPALTQQDLLTNKATFDQMAMWRIPVSGAVISAPVQVFELVASGDGALEVAEEALEKATAAQTAAAKATPIRREVTIASADLSGLTATVTVSGITADGIVFVSPANDASRAEWVACNVRCTAQSAGSLTFKADTAPSADITVNVAMWGV